MAADALQGAILVFQCGEDEECVEKQADPVEFFVEAEVEGVLLEKLELSFFQTNGVALLCGKARHGRIVIDSDDSMARLRHRDRGPATANGQLEDRVPGPQMFEKEW